MSSLDYEFFLIQSLSMVQLKMLLTFSSMEFCPNYLENGTKAPFYCNTQTPSCFHVDEANTESDVLFRAVGAGPAGPAAAGLMFGQLTLAKNAVGAMSFGGLFNCYSKSSNARRDLG